jgi:transcriptional regulator with XRE-family HTH domain
VQVENSEKIKFFSERLKWLRIRRGLNQADLARKLGFSTGSVGSWETETNLPSAKKLSRIADFFGVPIGYLLGEENGGKREKGGEGSVMWTGKDLSPADTNLVEGPIQACELREVSGVSSEGLFTVEWRGGDEMEPRYSRGDLLIVRKGGAVRDGSLVFAEREDGTVYFKVCHWAGEGKVMLTSYNPVYPPIAVEVSRLKYMYPVVRVVRVTERAEDPEDRPGGTGKLN